MKSDAQLIAAARREPAAFAELYERHARAVDSFLRARAPGQEASELTAETFARAALSLRRRPPAPCSRARRRRARRLCGSAVASGIADDLHLDPTQWSILGRGSVDDGKAEYAHAQRKSDGSGSTFMVEHDAGLAPYDAFLLHEKTLVAAGATEKCALCTSEDVTRAETIALGALRSAFPVGTDADGRRRLSIPRCARLSPRRAAPRVRRSGGPARVLRAATAGEADAGRG